MALEQSSCIKCVGGCKAVIKYGKTSSGQQRYLCKVCGKTKMSFYKYSAYCPELNSKIVILTKEGLGIWSTSRILQISTNTLMKRIVEIANNIKSPPIIKNRIYEVDEIRTFIRKKSKLSWIVYALDRITKGVVSFCVGNRTNNTLNTVITTLKLSGAQKIYTDGLNNYRYLIPADLHIVKRYGTNHIERCNLTLRTHLKRLNRRTICFSRSLVILNAVLKIYFWS